MKNSQNPNNLDRVGRQKDYRADSMGLDQDWNSTVLAPPAPALEQSRFRLHVGSRDQLAWEGNKWGDNCFLLSEAVCKGQVPVLVQKA